MNNPSPTDDHLQDADDTASSTNTSLGDQSSQDQLEQLHQTIEKLERKLAEAEEITKRAQSDYLRLKFDMDSLAARNEQAQKDARMQAVVDVAKRLLPFVSHLKKTITSLPADLESNTWAQGVTLIYTKLVKDLEGLHIYPIVSEGLPDLAQHIPVSTESVDDDTKKGMILKELEEGYVYQYEGVTKVIIPAKVIVGT